MPTLRSRNPRWGSPKRQADGRRVTRFGCHPDLYPSRLERTIRNVCSPGTLLSIATPDSCSNHFVPVGPIYHGPCFKSIRFVKTRSPSTRSRLNGSVHNSEGTFCVDQTMTSMRLNLLGVTPLTPIWLSRTTMEAWDRDVGGVL